MPNFTMEGLTDEQHKTIQAEIDRRVTEAVQTTTRKVTEDVTKTVAEQLQKEYDNRLSDAIKEAQLTAASTDAEKIAALEAALEAQRSAFEKSQLERKTEQALRDAGLSADSIATLTPLIVAGANAESIDANLDAFVNTQQAAISAALEKQKQELALGASAPNGGNGNTPPLNPDTQLQAIMNQEDVDPHISGAQAIQFLIDQAAGEGV